MLLPQGSGLPSPDTVYARLKDHIINYRFRPGEQLQISDLAEQLNMGKTPLREALTRLHGEELVISIPNRGFFAKMLTAGEMTARYELAFLILRYSIERDVAGFNLKGINKPMEPVWDAGRLTNATSEFVLSHAMFIEALYERIATLSENKVMIDNIRSFNDQTRYVRLIELDSSTTIKEVAADVFKLIELLETQDARSAILNLDAQLEKKRVLMNRLVEEGHLRVLRATVS